MQPPAPEAAASVPADPSYRPRRQLPGRPGQRPNDQIVSTEAGQLHRLDHTPGHIGEAPDGRIRCDQGAWGLSFGARRLHLPPCNRLDRHSKHRRRLALRQAEETADTQDPEALLGWVMRTMALRHLVPACPEYPGRLARHSEEQAPHTPDSETRRPVST
jgi:hypothetical protein